MKNKKWIFLSAFLVLLVLTTAYFVNRNQTVHISGKCTRCNFVLYSIDSLRARNMGLYGYKRQTTPHIDKWARKSWTFENYFGTSYLTPISEASVHTGLYPETNGMIGFRKPISDKVKTLAEVLKAHGYKTGAFGDSHEFKIFKSVRESFSRGFDKYFIKSRVDKNARGLDWNLINKFVEGSDRPFFLWVNSAVVHSPFGFKVPNQFADREKKTMFSNWWFFGNLDIYYDKKMYAPTEDHQFYMVDFNHGKPFVNEEALKNSSKVWPAPVTDEDLQHLQDEYDNGVAAADREFSHLLEALEKNGRLKDTVIILQSEHGEDLGENKMVSHYDIYDTTTHVPMVISSPSLEGAERINELVSGVDLYPTILSHLDLPADKLKVDGMNFIEDGRFIKKRDEVFITRTPLWESLLTIGKKKDTLFDRFRSYDDANPSRDYAIRTHDFKLIHRMARFIEQEFSVYRYVSGNFPVRKEFELYDLKNDPFEANPLDVEQRPEGIILKDKLLSFEKDISKRKVSTNPDPEIQDYR